MKTSVPYLWLFLWPLLYVGSHALAAEKSQPFRLPALPDRMPQVIWNSECEAPEGIRLAFGGQDQKSDDGRYHTQLKIGGEWLPLIETLRTGNRLQSLHDRLWRVRDKFKDSLSQARFKFLDGAIPELRIADAGDGNRIESELSSIADALNSVEPAGPSMTPYGKQQCRLASQHLAAAKNEIQKAATEGVQGDIAKGLKHLQAAQVHLEQAADGLDAEPGPRALSPLVYDGKSKLFVLFGGDHLDYLTNDVWVFDPDPAKRSWQQRHPPTSPAPRANHQLTAADGRIKLTGGYTYSNNTDYTGGQYVNLNDGAWTYDVAADSWASDEGREGVASGRTYRQNVFHPEFFLQGDPPDAKAVAARLRDLPANTWVAMQPPHLPQMNRDWGTAVIDPDHDVFLRWSGGHSAHGGTDVVMYHFNSNRWELPFPIEFPLGQCYSNTSYPAGFNFNRRPWVTGHTYKAYAYDAIGKEMVFVGQQADFFRFDTTIADWIGRGEKPNGMNYSGCFYDLLCKPTPQGIVCWTHDGRLFFYKGGSTWLEQKVAGEKLPNSNVDSAGIDYDSKRDRVLLFPCAYGKPYMGQVVSVDWKSMAAAALNPKGMTGAANMPGFLRETCFATTQDVVVCGVTLPPDGNGVRWTPIYDCQANQWIAGNIGGPNPAGKDGRNVSLGLAYDAKRDLIWAVDARSNIFVLRLDVASLNRKEL